jgi:uncharacterized Rossmann fold enzyme
MKGAIEVRWEIWRPRYESIVKRLGLNALADVKAAKVLNDLLPKPNFDGLANILRGKECVVFGAGPSLDEDLNNLKRAGYLEKVLVAADGATSAVIRYRRPEIIVTDLDGRVGDQLRAWRLGSWLVVHAHGDNLDQILEVVPKLDERVLGTTQVEPFGGLYNFGGFTDGDRAAFMAHELGSTTIYLAGMDLGKRIGRYSGDKDVSRKLIKLAICGELLAWLAGDLKARLVNLTSRGEDIPNVLRGSLDEKTGG